MDQKNEALLTFFKATSQPDRLRILGLLANDAYPAAKLAEMLGMKETAVVRHLHALQRAGLVSERTVAFTSVFSFNGTGLANLNDIVDGTVLPETLRERVLRDYVIENRLKAIPLDPEERQVILRWMAEKFELHRRYSETEVTDLVSQYYDKPLTLRRILADNRFLRHTGRQYWRPLPEHIY